MLIRVFGLNKGQREFICKIVSLASVWDFSNVVIRMQLSRGQIVRVTIHGTQSAVTD